VYIVVYNKSINGDECMKKVYGSKELIKIVEADGWFEVRHNGTSHRHFRHPTKPGIVTIPHPEKDVPKGTAGNILRQAGLKQPAPKTEKDKI